MEVLNQKCHLKRNKYDQSSTLQAMEDNSLVYKLRRSCDKIEQLMKEVDILKAENELKSKIIMSLQSKQRELILNIESYKHILQEQNHKLYDFNTKLMMASMKSMQQIQFEEQYSKLTYRYANCEEENITLRNQLKHLQQQINLLSDALVAAKTQNKQKQIQLSKLQGQNSVFEKQIGYLRHIEQQLDWLKTKNIEKDVQMELELAKYRQMLSKYSFQLQNSMKLEQKWFKDYNDLSDTVNHIEQLRQCFRIRKALK